jgi:hypothetical protein
MGYYIFSYGIKTDAIRAVFRSNDERLLEKIQRTESFANYTDQDIPFALREIVEGRPCKLSAHAYGYALICICEALGAAVPYRQEIKMWVETKLVNKYLMEDFAFDSLDMDGFFLLPDDSLPFDIPPMNDWPVIGLLKRERLLELAEKFRPIEISDAEIARLYDGNSEEEEDKGCAYEHIQGIRKNLFFCLENDLEMISFCH